jgi:hypothetical protein
LPALNAVGATLTLFIQMAVSVPSASTHKMLEWFVALNMILSSAVLGTTATELQEHAKRLHQDRAF